MNVRGGVRGVAAAWRQRGGRWWSSAVVLVGGVALLFLSGWIDTPAGQDPAPATGASAGSTAPEQPQSRGDDQRATPDAPPPPTDGTGDAGREAKGKGRGDGGGGAASEARGSIHEIADVEPGAVAKPVGIDDTADFGNGARVRLAAIEATRAEAVLPGERGGPAVVVTVEFANGSQRPVNLGNVTVDLTFGEGLSAYGVTDPEHTPLGGELAPGDATTGDYVFTLPPKNRADVQLRIKYSAETPTVVFAGSVADG